MPVKECIKHLYEREELSISEISRRLEVNWRTAAKFAREENWNQEQPRKKKRRRVMEPFADIVDTWLADRL